MLLLLLVVVGVVVVVVVQVSDWIHQGLVCALPGQPGQFGHVGNEQFTVRRMGSGGSSTGTFQFCITAMDMASCCLVFAVVYRWWVNVEYRMAPRGWRMMSCRFMQ